MRPPVSFPFRTPRLPQAARLLRLPLRELLRPRSLPGLLLGLLLAVALWMLTGLVPWSGVVMDVPDGDTIVVRDASGQDTRVRLYGIDAPELHQRGGEQARLALARMVMGRTVHLVTIDRDAYGRDVAHVRLAPLPWSATPSGGGGTEPAGEATAHLSANISTDISTDINGDMLRAGQAWFYGKYCNLPYPCIGWSADADEAREAGLGLWKSRNPTPPWEWRRRNR